MRDNKGIFAVVFLCLLAKNFGLGQVLRAQNPKNEYR